MQLKIDIEFKNSTESLLIELIDNPGVRAWAEHCKQIPKSRSTSKQSVVQHPLNPTPIVTDPSLWEQQQLVQQSLASTTLPMPLPVSAPDQITQHHLNVWHRWFTDHTHGVDINNPALATEFHWLHELNQIVHRLETSIYEWPKTELGTAGWDLNFQPDMNEHGFGIGYVNLAPYRHYHSWEHADLILDQAVHGKTTMQSFVDNDDPKHWDTTGHHISWGGCKLLNSTYRQGIYQGNLFRQWLDRNNVAQQDLWGDYLLGNIVNRDQAQIDRIFSYQKQDFVSVELTILD